jgi:hypothetical protein
MQKNQLQTLVLTSLTARQHTLHWNCYCSCAHDCSCGPYTSLGLLPSLLAAASQQHRRLTFIPLSAGLSKATPKH